MFVCWEGGGRRLNPDFSSELCTFAICWAGSRLWIDFIGVWVPVTIFLIKAIVKIYLIARDTIKRGWLLHVTV